MTNPAQIVHESETQRQFVRLQLPATTDIKGQRYTVKDLSSGGMAIRDIDKAVSKGEVIFLTLILPFPDFALDIEIKAEIQHIDKKTNVAGARFIDLTPNQISILNHVIKSFMAGDIVGTNDLLNVVSRENFVNIRKLNEEKSSTAIEKVKRYGIYGLVILATLLLGSFIINNIMEKLFIIKTPYGYVQVDTYAVLSPASGIYESALPVGAIGVKKGQIIGTVKTPAGDDNFTAYNVISPCDCFIVESSVLENEYKPQNADLFTLIPQESDINIRAEIPVEEIHRLNIGTKAVVSISGVPQDYKGTVVDILSNQNSDIPEEKTKAVVIIKTQQKIKNDVISRPAFVEFKL